MKTTFLLALRNIFRNKRRTSITFLSIISGMIGIIIFGGFVEYTFWGLRESTIKTQLGHVQIYKKGYSEKGIAQPNQFLLKDSDDIIQALKSIKKINVITKRLSASGLLSNGEKTLSCKVIGVEIDQESEFSNFETITDGTQLDESNSQEGGVMGIELMKALGTKVGDYVTLLTTTEDGALNAIEFKVIGVAQTGSQEYDSVFVKLPLVKVQNLLGTQSVEKMMILLNATEDMDVFIPILNRVIIDKKLDIEFKTWNELAIFYNKVVGVYKGIFKVISIIIGVIILFSVTNTLMMSIFERVREIGTLRAIGTTQKGILKLFVMEGFLLGVIGGALGLIVAILISNIINFSGGIYIPPPPGMSRGYIAFILTPLPLLLFSFTFTVIVTTVSSLYPAYQASRLKIVDALGHT
jgi:putative ABC transport system permease protein